MEIVNLDGTIRGEKKTLIDCPENYTARCFKVQYPDSLSSVYFIKLTLQRGGVKLSDR